MHKALVLIVLPGLFASLSIAEGGTHGKTAVSARNASAPARAEVRVVSYAREAKETNDTKETNETSVRTSRSSLPSTTLTSSSRALLSVVNQPDIRPADQLFLDRVLRAAPALCRESIEHLVVRYPSTEFTPSSVEGLKPSDIERGQATASTMILRGPLATLSRHEQAEMIGVIFHECGHIVDLGALQGSPAGGESAYPDGHVATYNDDPSRLFYEISWETPTKLRRDVREADFVSGYAKKGDAFEDLAESFVYYALHERAFRERANGNPVLARKLRWLETYVFVDGSSPTPSEGWDGTIAWDVTKLELSDHSLLALTSTYP